MENKLPTATQQLVEDKLFIVVFIHTQYELGWGTEVTSAQTLRTNSSYMLPQGRFSYTHIVTDYTM